MKLLVLISLFFFFQSCTERIPTSAKKGSKIEIGSYRFKFPSKFKLKKLQGVDSYVGVISGPHSSLSFDYGWYTRPMDERSNSEFLIVETEINGHYKQVVKALESPLNFAQIHLYRISDRVDNPNAYNALTISTKNISEREQKMIIEVFNNVEILN